jgi:8-oxo-dGTP pyrophosphatase MutT (NUDIX family)
MAGSKAIPEYSAGGVVFRKTGQGYEIVAVNRARHSDWSLPKGHLEEGETREQAALREVKEETGLDARIIEPIGEVVYFFRRPKGALVRKSVFHFLLEATNYDFSGPNWEVAEARWIAIEQAHTLLTYQNDLEIVGKARAMLEKGQ